MCLWRRYAGVAKLMIVVAGGGAAAAAVAYVVGAPAAVVASAADWCNVAWRRQHNLDLMQSTVDTAAALEVVHKTAGDNNGFCS